MNYQETLDYLYSRLPVFHNIGARAFKPGLQTTMELCKLAGNPQNDYPTIHIGGTNGKGSTSHMIAAILQKAGYKVGLYTSPHLKDFRERIRVNGIFANEDFIANFIADHKSNIDRLSPSFFEVAVSMAFAYFNYEKVDVAVIEVGMGGRLDSTNIIHPELSLITNISLDHTQFLGDTLEKIAAEKAGIIKQGVPVVISEYQSEEISTVFTQAATSLHASLYYGSQLYDITKVGFSNGRMNVKVFEKSTMELVFPNLQLDLTGDYQVKNLGGVLTAVKILKSKGWQIQDDDIVSALQSVVELNGLQGRWQKLQDNPAVYCDTAHNPAGLSETMKQFTSISSGQARFVIGFVGDKDISSMLKLFPANGKFYFCQPSNMRALKAEDLQRMALQVGLQGNVYPDVNEALKEAIWEADPDDTIYVGGSTFVVADLEQL
ncbi:bifunctional folylpolyglutamate synthase/dihydrofolate synthase [Dyadobacter sediminis]|uniref:Dihydrofolate synthase/folylpolyglutamate synthase n=1 Tax=Dyadobacter sediminis TaxID=1493691 RepID=A0A5R9KJC8_9BACT|nr:folylpolyglutamate synthase/dihydrofolate synthase family protein [Dyadobacter sediminis]TLU96229.1 bifunctional folylpolyglutamate synthase/dihydrofolate synthase [Dyadobacter sediminis]GGB80396.1 folylpolyglutamate synthase [Dyadobacter sediminis]